MSTEAYLLKTISGVLILSCSIFVHAQSKDIVIDAGHGDVQDLKSKVCQHVAPPQGSLLACDSNCDCETLGPKPQQGADRKASESSPKPTDAPNCSRAATTIVPPVYPAIARNNRIWGSVFVQVEVDEDGSVKQASVLEGHPMLRQVALDAAKRWRFDTSCSLVRTIGFRFRISEDDDSDPAGTYIHEDEVEIVVIVPAVDTATTSVVKSKKPQKIKKEKSITK